MKVTAGPDLSTGYEYVYTVTATREEWSGVLLDLEVVEGEDDVELEEATIELMRKLRKVGV